MPRPQFTLKTMLGAVTASAILIATVSALWRTQLGKVVVVSGMFACGVATIFMAARIYEKQPGTTWPVALGFLGVIVIIVSLPLLVACMFMGV